MTELEQNALIESFLAGAPADTPKETPVPAPEPDAPQAPEDKIEVPKAQEKPDNDPAARANAVLLKRLHERMRRMEEERKPEPTRQEPEWTPARQKANLRAYIKDVLKLDPDKAARGLMAEALGDDAPGEYRNIASQMRENGAFAEEVEAIRRENAELRARVEAIGGASEAAAVKADYQRAVDAYVVSEELEKTHPNAAPVIRADRQWAMGRIRDIVREDSTAKLAAYRADPSIDVRVMTAQEAVAALDEEIAAWQRRIGRSPVQNDKAEEKAPRKTMISTTPTAPPVSDRPKDEIEANYREAMHWLQTQ